MLLTVAEYRLLDPAASVEDDAIQLLLDVAEAEIDRAAGPLASATEFVRSGGRLTTLGRRAATVTSITEEPRFGPPVTLAADDYVVWPQGYVIERLATGTNPRSSWGDRSTIVYVPFDDEDIRRGVQLDLVKLALMYAPGLTSTTIGAWQEAYNQVAGAHEDEHDAILSRLRDGRAMVVVGERR